MMLMKTFYKQNVLNNLDFLKVSEFCINHLAKSEYVKYSNQHGRYYDFLDLPEEIKSIVMKSCRDEIDDQTLDIVYCQIVKYQIKDGVVPKLTKHKDNLYCTYIMDLVVDASINWPLEVEDMSYSGLKNSAVFLHGSTDLHGRPEYPSMSESDYVTNLFVHIAPEGDENLKKARELEKLPMEKRRKLINSLMPYIG